MATDLTPKFSIISAEDEIFIPEASDLSQLVGGQSLNQPITVNQGHLQSPDFVTGTSGWQIKADGTAEFQTVIAGAYIQIFVQTTPPTSLHINDIWYDSDDGNKPYRAAIAGADQITAGEWETITDGTIATAQAAAEAAQSDASTAITNAATAQGTADGKVTTFYADNEPTAEGTGDLWIDTNDGNKLYRWSGSAWTEVQDDDIATAITNASTAQTTADGKIVSFYADEPPTADGNGDYWTDTNDNNKLYRWSGSAWVSVRDATIATAQGTANIRITTFFQAGVPTSLAAGDIWFDTDDKNKMYRATGVGDTTIEAGKWVIARDTDIAQAISDASGAQGTADGKVTTFYQDDAPTATAIGDLWIDTNDGNKLYRTTATGSGNWVEVQDDDIAQAISDAGTAQTTADGKIVTFYQSAVPTATDAGDIFYDTDDGKTYRSTNIGDDQITAGEWERIDVGLNPSLVDALQTTNAPAAANADVTTDNPQSVAWLTAGTITSKAITLAVSAGTGDSKIQAGKTDFGDATSGFILGVDDSDSDLAKFEIGNATDYFKWDGSNISMLSSNANAIIIDYGSDILLKEGGDIKFTSVEDGNGLLITLALIEIAGNVDAGEHRYQVTFVNEAGETALTEGFYKGITTDGTHKQVALSTIPVSTSGSVTARKIYRTKADDNYNYYLLATISDNTTTVYTDNIADSGLTGGEASNMENSSYGKLFIDGGPALKLGFTNTFVGRASGFNITTGFNNTAIGRNSLAENTTGFNNSAVGLEALGKNTIGDNNSALGNYSLGFNTEGYGNSAIGTFSLVNNTTGINNSAVGAYSLFLNDTGNNNIALGYYAGKYETGSNVFYINNQDRTNIAGDRTKSILYGKMAANTVDQRLKVNAYLALSNHENITAYAGGGQANAVVVTGNVAEVGVCASAGDSVTLPEDLWATYEIGMEIMIMNHGAESCDVFPGAENTINGSSNAKALAVNASMLCTCFSDYEWECVTLAR